MTALITCAFKTGHYHSTSSKVEWVMFYAVAFAILAATFALAEAIGELALINHHPLGSDLVEAILDILCSARRHLRRNQEQQALGSSTYYRGDLSIRNGCSGISYGSNSISKGIDHKDPSISPENTVHYMHFVRHPVDMLVLSYQYLKSCPEKWTTDPYSATDTYLFIPQSFPVEGSYCKYLQESSLEDGLTMELARSLQAEDGIGNMLKNALYLENQQNLRVCIFETQSYLPVIQAYIAPWNSHDLSVDFQDVQHVQNDVQLKRPRSEADWAHHDHIGISTRASTSTDESSIAIAGSSTKPKQHDDANEFTNDWEDHDPEAVSIYLTALQVTRRAVPDEVLYTFPCGSDFFGRKEFKTSSEYFASLPQPRSPKFSEE